MTRTQAKFFMILLMKAIVYMQRNGGNRNTYQLEKLMQVKQDVIQMYGLDK